MNSANNKWKRSTKLPVPFKTTAVLHVASDPRVAIILVSVFLFFVIGGVSLYFYLKWKNNRQDPGSSSNSDQLNNRQLEHTAEDYEEIKEYNVPANSVYNNTKIHTDTSDSPSGLEQTTEKLDLEICSANNIT